MITKKIFIDALMGAMCLIIMIIIFEIIFFFTIIYKNLESNSRSLIDNLPEYKIDVDSLTNLQELKQNEKQVLNQNAKMKISLFIKKLVDVNNDKLNHKQKVCLIVLFVFVTIFILITIILLFFFRNIIDFKKITIFVSITVFITAICEIICYFNIFSKIRTTNEDNLMIKLYDILRNMI